MKHNSQISDPDLVLEKGDFHDNFISDFLDNPEFGRLSGEKFEQENRSDDYLIQGKIFNLKNSRHFQNRFTKEITSFKGSGKMGIKFERCLFIGGLVFEHFNLAHLSFINCQFINPIPKGCEGQDPNSLEIQECKLGILSFEKVITENEIFINKSSFDKIRFSEVICSNISLQAIEGEEELTLQTVKLIGKISMPRNMRFKQVRTDKISIEALKETNQELELMYL